MPEYTIVQGVGGSLHDSAVGFLKYANTAPIYWVHRDGVRLQRPYESYEQAQEAVRQFKLADDKAKAPPDEGRG